MVRFGYYLGMFISNPDEMILSYDVLGSLHQAIHHPIEHGKNDFAIKFEPI